MVMGSLKSKLHQVY